MALPDREAKLLDEMMDDPGDEELRLVFADTLLERGDPHGELIHLHVDGEDDSPSDRGERGRELLKKLTEQLTECGVSIFQGVSDSTRWFWHLTMQAETFLANLELVFAIGPIHHVRLEGSKPHVAALAACRHLRWVEGLELPDNKLDADDIEALVASPHVGRLRKLMLSSNPIGDRGAAAICATPFERLRNLDLGFTDLGADGFATVANARCLPTLQSLSLTGNDGTAAALAVALARARALTELGVSFNEQLDEAGAIAIAEATHLDRLSSLAIAGCWIRDRGVAALAAAPHLGKLTWLVLDRNKIGPAGAAALAASTTLSRNCRVRIRHQNRLDEPSLALLSERFQIM